MRILVDYRPALRDRTGVGEYVHELVRALAETAESGEQIAVFSSSWKDRPQASAMAELPAVRVVDRAIPVSVLNRLWNRWGWPPVETLAGACDLVHSATPLLIPSRNAAGVVTIHDLDFLRHPERVHAEVRRDFPALVRAHANRADAVVVSSHHVAADVTGTLGVDPTRIHVCLAGAPAWAAEVARQRPAIPRHHILFLGTLEPRKNIGVLLDAYAHLLAATTDVPPLLLAGRPTAASAAWQARIDAPPLAGHVQALGYVDGGRRVQLLRDAHMLVMPSLDEGFGLPLLEAMACGVPVVVSNAGSLPEVAGDAAEPVAPDDVEGLTRQMQALLDATTARAAATRGLVRAQHFSWTRAAQAVRHAYRAAVEHRAHRR